MTNPKIKFLEFHFPALESGDYEITVTQTISAGSKIASGNTFSRTQAIAVAGERFSLQPNLIQSVFPPAGTRGEHADILPHIILRRSTLPWERSLDGLPDGPPWLALLLFDEEETPEVTAVPLKDIKDGSQASPYFPGLTLEVSQSEDDMLTVIDVKREVLEKILPTRRELDYLSHVRQVPARDEQGNFLEDQLEELAVLIGNRFPKGESYSTVHLVSLEGRFENDGEFVYPTGSAGDDLIRLISLKTWTFYCDVVAGFRLTQRVKEKIISAGGFSNNALLDTLLADPALKDKEIIGDDEFIAMAAERAPALTAGDKQLLMKYAAVEKKSFTGLLLNLDRSPSTLQPVRDNADSNAEASRYLRSGFVPMPHRLRTGRRAVSWYRGPLLPGPDSNEDLNLDILSADELIRYDKNSGLLDLSYSSAWQLGRVLILQEQSIALSLFKWKRQNARKIREMERRLEYLMVGEEVAPELPEDVREWLEEKRLLKDVPFCYLVPEESMLPPESIRFFQVDLAWVDALLDGAFSVGRVTTADVEDDHDPPVDPEQGDISGILLRSQVVAGWPSLLVEGYESVIDHDDFEPNAEKLPLLRMERLAEDVLLCLFHGQVSTVDIHQKPEALQYGVDEVVEENKTFKKEFRRADGELSGVQRTFSDAWRSADDRVLDIASLFEAVKNDGSLGYGATFTAAHFGLAMIEGAEKVRWYKMG
jgi:hypothetical protein